MDSKGSPLVGVQGAKPPGGCQGSAAGLDRCRPDLASLDHPADRWRVENPPYAAAIAAFRVRTPAAGPSGWPHTQPITARKSAPACTSGAQFCAVMPPMAQHGSSISSDHQCRISGSTRLVTSLLPDGKNAPNAT